jgi:excinuclease ABC subunit C
MVLKDQVANFPHAPGVYLMKGSEGQVLYVGKALDLRRRVQSYFRAAGDGRYQIRFLMERTVTMEYLVTDTEKEALILENTLIKRHRPRYNLDLRDDKTYFSLRIDLAEEFPRLTIVRSIPQDGARYFGPYASAAAAREVVKQLQKIFPLRRYPLATCRKRSRPCLYHQIRQCAAPCHGLIGEAEYATLVRGAVLFLEGKSSDVVRGFREQMRQAAAAEHFEEAARFRDLLQAIETTLERQKMVTAGGDLDVLGFSREEKEMVVALLFVRNGALVGSRNFPVKWELADAEGVAAFLSAYYAGEVTVPPEILLPLELPEVAGLMEFLAERRGNVVRLLRPQRGPKRELVELATTNAATALSDQHQTEQAAEGVLRELQRHLHLPALPRRIECYDISMFQGGAAVGSRVVFQDGVPDKAGYRRYRITTVEGSDDFAMLQEVFRRRFGGEEPEALPDLILVDGGIGQLNVMVAVQAALGLTEVATASLAKSRVLKGGRSEEVARSNERVFLPGRRNPVVLRQNAAPLLLLARIRDEAHRFAVGYHRQLRQQQTLVSSLDGVPGIGPSRRKELLKAFGSLSRIAAASVAELCAVKGITPTLAEALLQRIKGEA